MVQNLRNGKVKKVKNAENRWKMLKNAENRWKEMVKFPGFSWKTVVVMDTFFFCWNGKVKIGEKWWKKVKKWGENWWKVLKSGQKYWKVVKSTEKWSMVVKNGIFINKEILPTRSFFCSQRRIAKQETPHFAVRNLLSQAMLKTLTWQIWSVKHNNGMRAAQP